jgi:hypothetical protein
VAQRCLPLANSDRAEEARPVARHLAAIAIGLLFAVQAQPQTDITQAWDKLLGNADAVARPSAAPHERDFLDHFYLESRSQFTRQQIGFTGQPTITGFTDALPGIFPGPFEPSSNTISQSLSFGTRGWLSPRISTDFSVRYMQDLTRVDPGSPTLSILETFAGNRHIELTEAVATISGLPSDGMFAGTNLRVGRQYVWGAELAAFDGASFAINRQDYSLTLFGGRRFTYFGDPQQRALGGGSLAVRLGLNTSLDYETLFYIRGSHSLRFRRRFGSSWLFHTGLRFVGSAPVDYTAQVLYQSPRTAFRLAFAQKLTDKDYIYDYTSSARDKDPYNTLARLNLGPLSPYSQVVLDARRTLFRRLGVGGAVWIRRLNDSRDQGPFETSFEDYRFNAQAFLPRRVELDLEFHQRHSDRLSPLTETTFDDVNQTGETRIQDLTAELRRSFGEGRLTLSAGGFYRRICMQDRYLGTQNSQEKGLLGAASLRMDSRTRVSFDYSLDSDFYLFRPSISNAQIFRLGLWWKY